MGEILADLRRPMLAALIIASLAAVGWLARSERGVGGVAAGDALASGGASFRLGMTGIRNGDHVYWMAPAPINESERTITLLAVSGEVVDAGVEFIESRVYRRSDFGDAPPLSWGGRFSDEQHNPARVKSIPVEGVHLAPGQTMEDVIMLHFRVTSSKSPLRVSGIRVEYEERGRRSSQVLSSTLELKAS